MHPSFLFIDEYVALRTVFPPKAAKDSDYCVNTFDSVIKRIVTTAGACFPLDLTHLGLTERALNVLAVSLIGLVLTDIIGDRFPLREKLLETVWLRYAVWVIPLAVTAVCGAYGTCFNPQEFVYFQF